MVPGPPGLNGRGNSSYAHQGSFPTVKAVAYIELHRYGLPAWLAEEDKLIGCSSSSSSRQRILNVEGSRGNSRMVDPLLISLPTTNSKPFDSLRLEKAKHQSGRVPQLPVELSELVIDFLWDDHEALRNCSLVCHSWAERSRYHLSRGISLFSREEFEALVRKARYPNFAASLQSICFLSVKDSFYNPAPWVHRLPLLLGHALSALDSLEVRFVNWAAVPLHPSTLSLGFSQFRLVTRLELHWCRFRNAKQLWHLICAFPRLRTLYVTEQPSSRAQARSFRHQASGRLPLLADVSFGGDASLASLFCTWLAQMEPRPPLRALTCWPEVQFAEELGTLLWTFGPTLECLTLYLDELDVTASNLDVFNVQHCTVLHTLKVWNLNSCIAVLQILRVISPASRIQSLFLHTLSPSHDTNEDDDDAYDGGEGTLEEWETTKQLLSHERFCELRHVTLVVDDELSVAEQRFVTNFIDHLRGRGIYVEASIHAEEGLSPTIY